MTTPPKAWVRVSHRTKQLHPSKRRYEVIYEDSLTGRQRTKGGFKSKAEAQDWRDDRVSAAKRGEIIDPQRADITFSELSEEYLSNRHFERAHTENDYRRHLTSKGSLLYKEFGAAKLGNMTHERLAKFIAELSAKRAPGTVRHYFYALKVVLDYAERTNRILRNPLIGIKPPSDKPPAHHEDERYPLTTTEIQQIIRNLPAPWDIFARVAAASGARPEETSALTLADITEDGAIKITKVLIEVKGRLLTEHYTKTSHSRRTVTLDSTTLRHLRTHITNHQRRALAWFTAHPEHEHPGDALPLWVGLTVGGSHDRSDIDRLDYSKPFRYSAFTKRIWAKAVKKTNLPPVNFYALRHAHASLLADRIGQPGALTLKEIQNRLGHRSATMTLDRYVRAGKADHDKTRDALDDALAPDTTATNVTRLADRRESR